MKLTNKYLKQLIKEVINESKLRINFCSECFFVDHSGSFILGADWNK
jgi:hypothetical protein